MTTPPDDGRADRRVATTRPGASERLGEGIAIVLRAEEEGRPSDLADWLARHPELALDLAEFLAGHKGLQSAAAGAGPGAVAGSQGGASVGGFVLGEEIGRGGMGVVFRAFDPALRRDVAVKLIRPGPSPWPGDRARFRFEAEAAASLDHPAVVPIHAFGESDGVPFLVMPVMEGGSLARRLRDLGPGRRLTPREAAGLVRDVALGVDHAHRRGILHRDLKPANVLLDGEGRPHVSDFGLALSLEASFSLSLGGSMAGTAAYMAPEQARGETSLTTAVDIHALGAILFELLAGRPPFGGRDWLATLQQVRDEVAPSPRRLRPDLPRDLETICLKCLEKAPEDRYPSAQALAEDLTRFLDGDPIGSSRRVWLSDLSRALDRRRETMSMTTWPGMFLAAGVLVAIQGVIQALVLEGAPGWWPYAALGLEIGGWLALYGWFLVARARALSPVERLSAALQLGMIAATLALVPAHIRAHGPDVLPLLPPMSVVLALGLFAHGATHWGRLYLAGLALLAASAAMPLLPARAWPTAHAAAFGGVLVWLGFRLRSFDRETRHPAQGRPPEPGV